MKVSTAMDFITTPPLSTQQVDPNNFDLLTLDVTTSDVYSNVKRVLNTQPAVWNENNTDSQLVIAGVLVGALVEQFGSVDEVKAVTVRWADRTGIFINPDDLHSTLQLASGRSGRVDVLTILNMSVIILAANYTKLFWDAPTRLS